MTSLTSHGISVDLPAGWEGRIYQSQASDSELRAGGISSSILHASNIALPADPGDFGSGAIAYLHAQGVFFSLFEYDREAINKALFSHQGIPHPLRESDLSPARLQRQLSGQAGAQLFFQDAGRAFCLYVVIGDYNARLQLLPIINQLIGSIGIE